MNGAVAERCAGRTLLYAQGAVAALREPSSRAASLSDVSLASDDLRPLEVFEAGERVPGTRFVVVRLLGQGGMGEVYEVEHAALGRRFAVKVLHRNHRGRLDLAARMRDEARSIGRLSHRSIPEVFDLGVTGCGRPYFAMELLHGRDLRVELARLGVIAVPTALALVAQALSALSVAHAAGIVHRDIKLENLFLCDDGALKLLDFGVAKLLHGGASLTAPDAVVGTPRTMSPEQCASGPIDPRADIYAMGLVLYELVAGRGPFDELRGQRDALRFAHCERPPPPPSSVAPQPLSPALEQLILRALAKAPERRFQTAAEMEAAVRRLIDGSRAIDTTEVDVSPPDGRRGGAGGVPYRATDPDGRSSARAGAASRGVAPRRAASRARRRAKLPSVRRPSATRAGALGAFALAVASAALGLVVAQRWLATEASGAPSAAAPHVATQLRSAVR